LVTMKQRLLVISPLFFLLLLALGACSGTSSAFNQYHRGRILDVSIVALERMPELRYRTVDSQQKVHHYLITPSEESMELVLMRLKVENHTATSAIVNIDEQAAELRDFLGGEYFPININERVKEVEAPENPGGEPLAACPLPERAADVRSRVCFLWNRTFEDGSTQAFRLERDYGIDGWMIFEAPKDTQFRELRWRGGDSLSIEF
jgi:hypothetical protein